MKNGVAGISGAEENMAWNGDDSININQAKNAISNLQLYVF